MVNILLGKIIDNADCDNSPKSLLLRDFNIAVAQGDLEFIGRHVTDDIVWHLLEPDGQKKIQGRDEVLAEYKHNMVIVPEKFTIDNVISHGNAGAANGRIRAKDGRSYAFCDVYKFKGNAKDSKIREMISYIIETRE